MTLEIGLETKNAHKRWYAGDFHTHSVHSDGKHLVSDMVTIAKAYGLDFFALTDHNSYAQNEEVAEDFVILPGLELTTPKGHSNFVGIKRPFESFDYRTKESLYKMFDQGMDAGCFISVNHPFVGDVWKWGFDMKFHAIELWNGTPLSRNQGALDWWQEELSRGCKVLATGGSDVHVHDLSGRCFGRGRTLVLADSLSRKHLLEGLHRGNISVATCEKSGFVDLKIGDTRVGETYYLKNEKQLKLDIDLLMDEPSELKLYTNEGLVASYNLDGHELSKNLLIPVGHKFYRLELWGRNNTHAFFTNPIYIERQKMHTI
nr:CehA/McbA family metallohydrolase [Acidaminobacter sp. JC074]